MSAEPTRRPWLMGAAGDPHSHVRIYGGLDQKLIAAVGNAEDCLGACDEWEANAALIVRAANAHEHLLGALREIVDIAELTATRGDLAYDLGQIISRAQAAIAHGVKR